MLVVADSLVSLALAVYHMCTTLVVPGNVLVAAWNGFVYSVAYIVGRTGH